MNTYFFIYFANHFFPLIDKKNMCNNEIHIYNIKKFLYNINLYIIYIRYHVKIEWTNDIYSLVITYKAIASAFAGLSVRDDDRFFDISVNVKMFPETLVGGMIGQAADEQLRPCCVLLLWRSTRQGSQPLYQFVGRWGTHGAHTETRGTRHQHPPNFGEIAAGRNNDLLNLDTFFGTSVNVNHATGRAAFRHEMLSVLQTKRNLC